MILSQINLRAAVEAGEISFDPPLEEKQWGEASIDLRLGFSFTRISEAGSMTLLTGWQRLENQVCGQRKNCS